MFSHITEIFYLLMAVAITKPMDPYPGSDQIYSNTRTKYSASPPQTWIKKHLDPKNTSCWRTYETCPCSSSLSHPAFSCLLKTGTAGLSNRGKIYSQNLLYNFFNIKTFASSQSLWNYVFITSFCICLYYELLQWFMNFWWFHSLTVKTFSGCPLALQLVSWTCFRIIQASSCFACCSTQNHTDLNIFKEKLLR